MRVVRWFGKYIYYFSFAVVLLLTSSVIAIAGNNFSFSEYPGGERDDETPELIVSAEPAVQSVQTGSTPPNVNPEDNYYIDENGNWIAGTAPPKPEPKPVTSSWCGEKKHKKWQSSGCQEISCPDYVSGPRVNWYNSCDPCQSGLFQRVCAHTESRDSH